MRPLAVLFAALTFAAPALAAQDGEVDRRVDALAADLRCPVCQNLSVKDSPSDVAASFRARIRQLVLAGRSDEEIENFFVARYGEWILLSPPKRGLGLAVWLAPGLLLAAGLGTAVIAVAAWRRRGERLATVPLSQERLERELRELEQQRAEGDLEPRDYQLLRERTLSRAAARPAALAARAVSRWRWPLAGAAAATVIAVTLAPALRQRGANDFPTGNDFGDVELVGSGVREWQAAEQAAQNGKTAEALEHFRLAVAFLPDEAPLRARFGFTLAQANRDAEALEQLRRAVRADPSLPIARLYLGAVLLKDGKTEAAFREWRRYLALEPDGEGAKLVRRVMAARK